MNKIITLSIFIVFLIGSVCATTYHIDPTAGTNGDGSANSPFLSWGDLPSVQTGDDVFFKCGTVFSPENILNISWEGTENNPAIIGAYYIEGGEAVYGCPEQKLRPIISGSDYTVPSNDCFGSENIAGALISVICKDYIHIQDLQIYRSGNRGIEIKGDWDTKANSEHFHIKNIFINSAYGMGILVEKNHHCYGIIEDCEVTRTSYSYHAKCVSGWGVSIGIFGCPYSNTIVRNNRIHENWGEGICSGKVQCLQRVANSGHVTIEDNVIWNNRRVDIYTSRTENNIIRRNICLGAGRNTSFGGSWSDDRPWNQFGVWVNNEERGDCHSSSNGNIVYNNLIAGHYSGISIGTAYSSGTMENNRFYNNTVVGNHYNLRTVLSNNLRYFTTNNLMYQNNVFYCPPGSDCSNIDSDPGWFDSKLNANHNVWTNHIPSNVGDSSDILIQTSDLVNSYNWQNIKESDIDLIVEKFRELLQETDALDQGVALDSIFTGDYFNLSRSSDTNGWDAGAFEYGIEEPQYDSIWSCCVDKNDYSQITSNINKNIKNQKGFKYRVYPNPTSGELNISGVESGTQIQVMNSTGSIVRNIELQNNAISLDGLPSGLYMIFIRDKDKLLGSCKAIKNRF